MSGNLTQSAAPNVSAALMKRFLALSILLLCLVLGYLSLAVPLRKRIAGLFSLDYEVAVEVVQAHKRALGRTLSARGELLALREVRINAPIPGTVKEMRFVVGDRVDTGAVIANIEPSDFAERLANQEAAVKEAEEQIENSETQLITAEKQLAAMRDLYQKNFIARRDVEMAEAAVITARVQKEALESRLAQRRSVTMQTRHILRPARITAPAGGFVSRRWAEPGTRVADAAPLLSIAHTETLKIVLNVKSADAQAIQPGTPAQVRVTELPDKVFRGRVMQVQELANFSGDESSIEIEMPNRNGELKTGTTATVSLPVGEHRDGIFVPKEALVQTQGQASQLFVLENGKARSRTVLPGEEHDSEIEVVSGIEPGEVVVVKGVERLRDGSRVLAVE
jgi:RND family efflux transporter MFP subunit